MGVYGIRNPQDGPRFRRAETLLHVMALIAEHDRRTAQDDARGQEPESRVQAARHEIPGGHERKADIDGMGNHAVDSLRDQFGGRRNVHRQSLAVPDERPPPRGHDPKSDRHDGPAQRRRPCRREIGDYPIECLRPKDQQRRNDNHEQDAIRNVPSDSTPVRHGGTGRLRRSLLPCRDRCLPGTQANIRTAQNAGMSPSPHGTANLRPVPGDAMPPSPPSHQNAQAAASANHLFREKLMM